jgi:hypothetical protein
MDPNLALNFIPLTSELDAVNIIGMAMTPCRIIGVQLAPSGASFLFVVQDEKGIRAIHPICIMPPVRQL